MEANTPQDPRSEFIEERAEKVRQSLGALLLAHYEENPNARWSAASVVYRVAEETGISKALITGHLQEFSDRKDPIVEEGPTINWGVFEGNHFIQVVPTENPIHDLREVET